MYDEHSSSHMYVLTLGQTSAVRRPSAVVVHPPQMVLPVQQGPGLGLDPLEALLPADPPAQVLRTRHHSMVWGCLLQVQHSSVLL
jgi:hypothetical protein